MVEVVQAHAVAANAWLMAVLAIFHLTVTGLLGLAIWKTLTYRAPLHEEFIGAMPSERERPEPAPPAERPARISEPPGTPSDIEASD